MNQKRFINILVVIGIVIIAGVAGYFVVNRQTDSTPTPVACTLEAKLCPDGSYVGRTGPNCEFALCPSEALCEGGECPEVKPLPVTECKKDSDCPSSQYVCQETQGMGTVCPSNDKSCVPTYTVLKGECKLKEGNRCSVDSDCAAGNLCHKNICMSPIGRQCGGPSDTSCPTDFECVQSCGPPVVRGDEPPPLHYCQLKGYIRNCPICLAGEALIDTPLGSVAVKDLQVGMPIWTADSAGHRISGIVTKTSKTPVPLTHQVVHLTLDDGRELFVSPGHPTTDGRAVGEFIADDFYDGARVVSSSRVPYGDLATYDILPSGETGFYWANGILLDSTLH